MQRQNWRVGTGPRASVLLGLALAAPLLFAPPLRHLAFYNLLPLLSLCACLSLAARCVSKGILMGVLVGAIGLMHLRSLLVDPILLLPDSYGYLEWGRRFAQGEGFPGMIYRTPLYSFLLGSTFLFTESLFAMVVIQHLALLGSSLLTFRLAIECHLGRRVALLSMALVSLNSVLMQMGQAILTEAVFVFLVLLSLLVLIRLYKMPTSANALLTGMCFAAASYLRPLLVPILLGGLGILLVRKGRTVLRYALIVLAVYFVCVAPWSLRNCYRHGTFSMSSSLGIQSLTKVTSYGIGYGDTRAYRSVEVILENVLRDLGLVGYEAPRHPEDTWVINHIPHAFADSLVAHHGYSFAQAERLMRWVSLSSFATHPRRYGVSVGKALATMLFDHRDFYPDMDAVLPIPADRLSPLVVRFVRGLLYLPGVLFLLYPAVLLLRGRQALGAITPFLVPCAGLLLTALVQVGFTRYTVPWIPLQAICVSVVVCSLSGMLERAWVGVRTER